MHRVRWWTDTRGVVVALVLGCGVPLAVGLVVPHDVGRINIPMVPMLFGIVGATLIGGALTGIVAGLASSAALSYWFFGPTDSFSIPTDTDAISLVVFAAMAIAVIALVTVLVRRASTEAELRGAAEAEARVEGEMLAAIQQALLPRSTLLLDDAEVAARYLGASRADLMGGDWYLVVEIDADRVALAVGDVTGHGIDATAVMAELRFAMKAYAHIDATPSEVLRRLNALHCAAHGDRFASALFGILDRRRRTWVHASAGHCPPVVVDDDGARILDGSRPGPLLGAREDARYADHCFDVPGGVLVLYTDGLVERHAESLDVGIRRLADAVSVAVTSKPPLPELCDTVLDAMENHDIDDDIVILAVRQHR